jgi:hypothetical protein
MHRSHISALKIHISKTTRDLLKSAGGFVMEDRGLMDLKVSGTTKSFLSYKS